MKKQKTFREFGMKRMTLFLLLCMGLFLNVPFVDAQNQKNKVTGVVKDVAGETVIGASVIEKGSAGNGTITDLEGNFLLNVSPKATLIISYIGYATQEVPVNGKSFLNVELKEDSKTLDEVVVVGFGTQKKVNLTGSVGTVAAEALESRPVANAVQALQGLIPGLNITTNGGALDKNMELNVRGTGTIGEGTSGSPLVLIDGMEGDLNTINPQDIANISVLKDAAASSIYGSRAPFGVILITTKTGKAGKSIVNYNNSFRFSNPINLPEMMDSYTFANYFNAGARNTGWGNQFTDDIMQKMLDYQAGEISGGIDASSNGQWGKPDFDPFLKGYANTDWYGEIFKKSTFSQEHNFSMSGGSEKVTYYASVNYLGQGGLLNFGGDNMNRFNANAKINATLTSWLKFNYGVRFTRTDHDRPSSFNDGFYEKLGRQTWPNLPIYDPNGYFFDGNGDTPIMKLELGGDRTTQTDQMYHQAAFVLEPIKNWVTNIEFNYRTNTVDVRETSLPYYNHDVDGNVLNTNSSSSIYQSYQKENYLNLNVFSEYFYSLNEEHNFKVMVGFQAEEMDQSYFSAKKYGLILDELPEFDLSTGLDGAGKDQATEANGYRNSWSNAGFFGRVNYDYKGRYLAEVNMRYDGSSRFRADNRWSLFPSFSLGWNIARESFWEPLTEVVNTLKVRGSYGELGNQNTTVWYPTYQVVEFKTSDGGWLQDGVKPNLAKTPGLISQALTWETVRTWNVGLDWGLFNNRLTGGFDVYTRYTDNMVGPSPELPYVLGTAVPKTNNCDLKTVGWELSLGWNDRMRNGLGYGVKLMLSDAQTTIESYPGNPTNNVWGYRKGGKLGEIWGFETVGIAKSQEEMDAHLLALGDGGQNAIGSKWGAGDIMYRNLDGKPGITKGSETMDDHGDLKVIGNNTPRYQFGIDLSADWKGLDIRAFFQGVMKRDYWQGSNMFWGCVEDMWWSAGLNAHGDYFRPEPTGLNNEIPANLDSYYPRPIFSWDSNGPAKNHQNQSRYLQDASYIRLKNLQVGYTLPTAVISKISLSKCRIYVSGENLWTGTSLSELFDPETISGGNTNSDANSFIKGGGNAYPLSRTFSFGISLTL